MNNNQQAKSDSAPPVSVRFHLSSLAFLFPAILLTIYYAWGVPRVPFHPDESTQLFMSSDFEIYFTQPLSMAWSPLREDDLRQRYRQLDAPLTRYILGFGGWLAGLPALPTDWDWSKTWQENDAAGALPDQDLLFVGRLSITLLLPISLFFLYRNGSALGGIPTGLLAALLMGINALTLLHNRRAMAEGALTLGITFALWSFLQADRRPWLAGIGMALAFNAKQSALGLFPIGLLASAWITPLAGTPRINQSILRIASNAAQYLLAFILLTFALNPLLWSNPLQASKVAWAQRQELLQRQVEDTQRLAPQQMLETPAERTLVLIANLYLAPLAFYEVGNYRAQTAPAEAEYLATPGHNLLRNPVGAGLLLILTLFGLALAVLQLRKAKTEQRRAIVLLLSATLLQSITLIIAVPLPWQRYAMPLLPFVSLWAAYAIGSKLQRKKTGNHPKEASQ